MPTPKEVVAGNVDDESMEHKLHRIVLSPSHGGIQEDYTSFGAGGQIAEVSVGDAEVVGFSVNTADELYWLVDMPWDIDLRRDILAEVLWESAKSGATAGVAHTLHIKGLAAGAALTDAKSSADGSIAWTAQGCAAPGVLALTGRKPFNVAGTFCTEAGSSQFPRELSAQDEMLLVAYTMTDIGDAAADNIRLLAVRLFYSAEICHYSGKRQVT